MPKRCNYRDETFPYTPPFPYYPYYHFLSEGINKVGLVNAAHPLTFNCLLPGQMATERTHFTLLLVTAPGVTEGRGVCGMVVTAYASLYAKNKIQVEMSPVCYQAVISTVPRPRQGLAARRRINHSSLDWISCCAAGDARVRARPAGMGDRNQWVCPLKRIAVSISCEKVHVCWLG